MDPLTHTLASVALARAAFARRTRWATPLAVAAGLAPDLDLLSRLAGAGAYIEHHRVLAHSLAGAAVVSTMVAAAFWWSGRNHKVKPLRFLPAFATCLTAAGLHLALDLLNPQGARLLAPLDARWFALDWVELLDPWILAILLSGLLLTGLFRLVLEEIGARTERRGGQRGAIVALVLLFGYCGARAVLHSRAVGMLTSQLYHRAAPQRAAALPEPLSPLVWQGVVETENTLEEIMVELGPGSDFDPDQSRTHYKPEASPALTAALETPSARRFLHYARFPLAGVQKLSAEEGFLVELRDLRFVRAQRRWSQPRGVITRVRLDPQLRVLEESLQFASDAPR